MDFLSVGDLIPIYQKPVSEEDFEGHAKVREILQVDIMRKNTLVKVKCTFVDGIEGYEETVERDLYLKRD